MSIVFIAICLTVSGLAVRQFLRNLDAQYGRPANLAIAAVGSFLCILSPVLLLQFLGSFVVSVIALLPFPKRVPQVLYIAVAVASYIFVLSLVIPRLREYSELRHEYPYISLEQRLGELTYALPRESKSDGAPVVRVSDDVEHRLDQVEKDGGSNMRVRMLEKLHDLTTDDFALAQGFGQIRMLMPRRESIELPPLKPVPFESRPAKPSFRPNGSAVDEPEPIVNPLSVTQLQTLHFDGTSDFFRPSRLGHFRDRGHVAGFVPHRFSQMPGTEPNYSRFSGWREQPQPEIPTPREESRINWAIVRLELIGLLRHPDPVAYVSDHLPQLEEVASYPTRELTDFESTALERLRVDEDVMIDEQPNRIRMLGSLRANSGCIKCHQVERGALLGALSYELVADHHHVENHTP